MNWNDELCGVKVTPESWAGGIVIDWSGRWWQALINPGKNGKPKKHREWLMDTHGGEFGSKHLPYFTDGPPGYKTRADQIPPDRWEYEPIFPPRGWAGKTDAELWREMFQNCDAEIDHHVRVMPNGKVWLQCHTVDNEIYVPDPAALILALSNARVLAARLLEVQK